MTANAVWNYDFAFDACSNGHLLKCLTMVDEYTRECLPIDVAESICSLRVIDVLSRWISVHCAPRYIRLAMSCIHPCTSAVISPSGTRVRMSSRLGLLSCAKCHVHPF